MLLQNSKNLWPTNQPINLFVNSKWNGGRRRKNLPIFARLQAAWIENVRGID
jgi:hypothetical protein